MIRKKTMAAVAERGWGYVVGCQLRYEKEFREKVL